MKGRILLKGKRKLPPWRASSSRAGRCLFPITTSPAPGRAPGAWQALVTYEHLSSKTYFTTAKKQHLNALKMLFNFITLSQS